MPVTARITGKGVFEYTPLSSLQMRAIAQEVTDSILARIKRGDNVRDAAAKSLTAIYLRRKTKRGDASIRDWFWTGKTLSALKVLKADENGFKIGFSNTLANTIAGSQNRRERVFGMSPSDKRVLNAAVLKALQRHEIIHFQQIA